MANWELLDKAFYSAIDNMSDDNWDNWHKNQEKNQSMRHEKMQRDWTLHLMKLSSKNMSDRLLYASKIFNSVSFNKDTKHLKIVASPQLAFLFHKKSQGLVNVH